MKRRMLAVCAAAVMLVGACSSDDDGEDAAAETTAAAAEETTAAPAPETTAAAAEETETTAAAEETETTPAEAGGAKVCGLGTGEPASGDPIKIGAVMTNVPGIEFIDGPNSQQAYFDCVNANGGINGRPLELIVENDELDPGKAGAAAAKLIESDGIVAMVGGFSILDCPVNQAYYEEKNFNVIVAGVPAECFGSPNIAAVNMGPHYSAQGAAEYVVRAGAEGKLVHVTGDQPGAAYNGSSIATLAEQNGLEFEDVLVTLPITDGASLARDLVDRAGPGGGVIITAVPSQTLAIMQGAADQGIIDDVIWGSATPANDLSVAAAVGPEWDGKIGINAELSMLDEVNPDMDLYRAVMEEYGGDTPLGSFGQMGFLMGQIIVDALLGIEGDITPETVNAAIEAVRDYETGILCKGWYFGDGDLHIPNNWDLTVTPDGDGFKLLEDCFQITALDPALEYVRQWEADNGVG
jgi:branched-chain amino acid transport system substrate-binding protein